MLFLVALHATPASLLLRDAANTLAALSSAGRIFDDTDVWPHREVFPLPLVLAKRVAASLTKLRDECHSTLPTGFKTMLAKHGEGADL